MENNNVKIMIVDSKLEKQITLENYLGMSENEKGMSFFKKQIENEELKNNLNGKGKHLGVTEIVNKLEIEGLTSTIFNRWMSNMGYGEMNKINNQKKRYFEPNENFINTIVKNGYAQTGITSTGKPKVSYRPEIIEKLKRKEIIQSLNEYVLKEA